MFEDEYTVNKIDIGSYILDHEIKAEDEVRENFKNISTEN